MSDYGFVYCLSNRCMPGIYKIGKTSRPVTVRAIELSSSTSVPTGFDVLFYIETPTMSDLEIQMHDQFDDYRVSSNREFFECDPREIMCVLEAEACDGSPLAVTGYWLELKESLDIGDDITLKTRRESIDGQNQDG